MKSATVAESSHTERRGLTYRSLLALAVESPICSPANIDVKGTVIGTLIYIFSGYNEDKQHTP